MTNLLISQVNEQLSPVIINNNKKKKLWIF